MKTKTLAVALVVALLPSTLLSLPTAQAQAPFVDADDYSSNPAFAQYFRQDVVFSRDKCSNATDDSPDECAVIKAPRNWQDASKGSLTLALARKVGATPAGKRLLLSNPGGPGGSGQRFGALAVPELLKTDATHYSVGMDPRGVGDSSPLTCKPPQRRARHLRRQQHRLHPTPVGSRRP